MVDLYTAHYAIALPSTFFTEKDRPDAASNSFMHRTWGVPLTILSIEPRRAELK